MKIFKKILIANRGEIAVRIIKSAKKLGIITVAVYADADRNSLHTQKADEAYYLEGNELSETYLNIDKIIEIAKISSCEAIHPGYGFLAENPVFVAACEREGITFIGPDTNAIKLMGNKIESRKFVKEIGIPLTEGITGDTNELIEKAKTIELPILVKAAAGGGGKGMRIVRDYKDLPEILESTSREAKSYFGDGSIFIEKYVEEPRHIEVQIIGDHFGNIIHLYERECSIQRRYQKIIEESPSPTLTQEVREKMGASAVSIAKAINYKNAGTIEFLLDKNQNFYFLEMNTRVQVEHPVTEMVTGIDIVKEQILIAANNELKIKQSDIVQNGHAIECRVYAEDPTQNFMPSPGDITFYKEPKGQNIRIDSSMDEPSTIYSFFDPMISKLIVWDENRELARERIYHALNDYIIHGIKTNIGYMQAILNHDAFINNLISTKFCDEFTDSLVNQINSDFANQNPHFAIVAFLVYEFNKFRFESEQNQDVWHEIGFWRHTMELDIQLNGKTFHIEIPSKYNTHYCFKIEDATYNCVLKNILKGELQLIINQASYKFYVSEDQKSNGFISIRNHIFELKRLDILSKGESYESSGSGFGNDKVTSPMPGKVIKINVQQDDIVTKNQVLLVVEAMKMENNILAPYEGKVAKVNISLNDMVDKNSELIVIEKIED